MADRHDERGTSDLTRRAFLGGTAAAAATAILAACGSSSAATSTPAPTKAPAAAASPAAASPAASGASPAAAATVAPTAAAAQPAATTAAASASAPAATTGAAAPAPTTAAAAGGTPKKGGILKVGLQADPVALDPHSTSLTATNHIIEHIYGRLVTIDATLSPQAGPRGVVGHLAGRPRLYLQIAQGRQVP